MQITAISRPHQRHGGRRRGEGQRITYIIWQFDVFVNSEIYHFCGFAWFDIFRETWASTVLHSVKSETNQNQFVIYGVNNPKIIDWNSQSMASDDNENKQKHKTTKSKQRQSEREGERERQTKLSLNLDQIDSPEKCLYLYRKEAHTKNQFDANALFMSWRMGWEGMARLWLWMWMRAACVNFVCWKFIKSIFDTSRRTSLVANVCLLYGCGCVCVQWNEINRLRSVSHRWEMSK